MQRTTLLIVLLLSAGMAAADTGKVVLAPSWRYRFPSGILGADSSQTSADMRYLAVTTARWTYHPVGKPEQSTSEGENAVYYFDLVQKRLLWKQVLPEGLAGYVLGVVPSGDFVIVKVGQSWHGAFEMRRQGSKRGEPTEGVQVTGPPEPGLRVYDRSGRLVGARLPLEAIGSAWPNGSRLRLREPKPGEVPMPDDLREPLGLAAPGIASGMRPMPPLWLDVQYDSWTLLSYGDDGTVAWRWPVPKGEDVYGGRYQRLAVSPDWAFGLLVLTPITSSATRRLYLFSRERGIAWSRQYDNIGDWMEVAVSNEARSILMYHGATYAWVDIRGADGEVRSHYDFGAVKPEEIALSPDGVYWAAGLRRATKGPGVEDKGWKEGLYVFDCDTGKIVWSSPAMAGALPIVVTDSGGVTAFSRKDRALVVFDLPHERVPERGQPPDSGEERHCEGRP